MVRERAISPDAGCTSSNPCAAESVKTGTASYLPRANQARNRLGRGEAVLDQLVRLQRLPAGKADDVSATCMATMPRPYNHGVSTIEQRTMQQDVQTDAEARKTHKSIPASPRNSPIECSAKTQPEDHSQVIRTHQPTSCNVRGTVLNGLAIVQHCSARWCHGQNA